MRKRFEALDAFRGVCASSVVVFHMALVSSLTELNFFRNSYIFVEFFFVLSGFVLAHGYAYRDELKFKPYMTARFFRLYPLHLFMFIVFIALELLKYFAAKYANLNFNNEPFTGSTAFQEILPNLLLIQSWVPFADSLSFNYPSWSISIEFYMYAILFFTIVFFQSKKPIVWLFISIVAFILIFLDSDIFKSSVLRGLSCFFGGAFIYTLYRKISHMKVPYRIGSLIEFALIFLIIGILQLQINLQSILVSLLFMLTVLTFSFESGYISKVLKTPSFQYLGKLSYSIYMTHAAILFCLTSTAMVLQKVTGIEFAPMLDSRRYLDFGNSAINNIVIVLILVIVIIVSHFTYYHIEIKGQKLGRKLQ